MVALLQGTFPNEEKNAKTQQINSTETPNPKFLKLRGLTAFGNFINYISRFNKNGVRNKCPILDSVTIVKGLVPLLNLSVHGLYPREPALLTLCFSADKGNHHEISIFVSNLRPGSIRHFACQDDEQINATVLASLSNQCTSLRSLALAVKDLNELQHLSKCPNLEILYISSYGSTTGTNTSDSTGLASWLEYCKSLKDLELDGYKMEPSAIINLLLDKEIPLSSMHICFGGNGLDRNFYRALATRDSLTDLHLENDSRRVDDAQRIEVMECLLCLGSLTSLSVISGGDFEDHDIRSLARQLTCLKSLNFGYLAITDTVWTDLSSLTSLSDLSLTGDSEFTLDGFLSFVSKLGSGNDRLVVNIDASAYSSKILTSDEVSRAGGRMKEKVNGAFYYQHEDDLNSDENYDEEEEEKEDDDDGSEDHE